MSGHRSGSSFARSRTGAAAVLAVAVLAMGLLPAFARAAAPPVTDPLSSIAVGSFRGRGDLAVLSSRDLARTQPDITRAVITIHGQGRDAETYDRIAQRGLAKAGAAGKGTILLTPWFAAQRASFTPADTLLWTDTGWTEGGLSNGPAPIGSFEALDAVLSRLRDKTRFPALRTIVLVGHSAGAQLVQRYAVLGHLPPQAEHDGIDIRFVIANPSSYSYFTADRPTATGGFAPFPLDQCHRFNDWKYGMRDLPDYAETTDPNALERDYIARNIVYLLGTTDTDPTLRALDKSCAAEAQGPSHYARGQAFVRYLQLRHPVGLNQREMDIDGVGHDPSSMLTSDCALAAIYDAPVCGNHPRTPPSAPVAASPVPPPTPAAPPVKPPAPSAMHTRRHAPPPRRHVIARPAREPDWRWQPGNWVWKGETYVWVPEGWVRARPEW